jgi:hypothetical protein
LLKNHENIIKYGSNIISEKWSWGSGYSTHDECNIYINDKEYQVSNSVYGDGDSNFT